MTAQPPGFAALAPRYDGLVLDLWGVVHDGVAPYPGVLDCLGRLREAGKRVVLLSNAPRRGEAARVALRGMGIADALYDGIVTSGDAARAAIAGRHRPGASAWFAGLGPRMFHLGPARDRNVWEGLDVVEAATPDNADWVLNTGPDDLSDASSLVPFEPVLDTCLRRRLPMLCANPDLEVVRAGRRILCAGALAEHYAARGGAVRMLGKPDPAIYADVLTLLALPPARVLAVGDSLRTDIAGAAAAGLDACWITGGIHAGEADPGAALARAELPAVALLSRFAW